MKLRKLILLSLLTFLTINSFAQSKFGHINAEEVMLLMPELAAADKILKQQEQDAELAIKSMLAERDVIEQNYNQNEANLSDLEKQDAAAKYQDLSERIQLYDKTATQNLVAKQKELYAPIESKLINAINEVAEENKYTYIFQNGVFLYADEANDITNLVKKKLGL